MIALMLTYTDGNPIPSAPSPSQSQRSPGRPAVNRLPFDMRCQLVQCLVDGGNEAHRRLLDEHGHQVARRSWTDMYPLPGPGVARPTVPPAASRRDMELHLRQREADTRREESAAWCRRRVTRTAICADMRQLVTWQVGDPQYEQQQSARPHHARSRREPP